MTNTQKQLNASRTSREKYILYVILHGLITLVDTGKAYIAYLLEMGDEHRYLYGNWMIEDSISRRRDGQNPMVAVLKGVHHGRGPTSELMPELNAVLKIKKVNPISDSRIRAIFYLPRPQKIHHFVCGKLFKNSLKIDPGEFVNSTPPTFLSAIRIFEYEIVMGREGPRARLVSRDRSPLWTCPALAPIPSTNRKVAVLHIYDEPGFSLNDESAKKHNLQEFKLSMEFLGKSQTLTKVTGMAISRPKGQPSVPGLVTGETGTLDQREQQFLQFLVDARSGSEFSQDVGSGGPVCSGGNAKVMQTDRMKTSKRPNIRHLSD